MVTVVGRHSLRLHEPGGMCSLGVDFVDRNLAYCAGVALSDQHSQFLFLFYFIHHSVWWGIILANLTDESTQRNMPLG